MIRLALALALAACASPAAPPPAAPVVPDTAAGHQLQWVVDTIAVRDGKVERDEVGRRFAPVFLDQVPADKVVELFAELAKQLPGLAIAEVKTDSPTHLTARATSAKQRLKIRVDVDAKTQQIDGLLLGPELAEPAKFASFDEAQRAVAALAPHASLLIASVDHGTCTPIHSVDADRELAIGAAKL